MGKLRRSGEDYGSVRHGKGRRIGDAGCRLAKNPEQTVADLEHRQMWRDQLGQVLVCKDQEKIGL